MNFHYFEGLLINLSACICMYVCMYVRYMYECMYYNVHMLLRKVLAMYVYKS
jgi:hypothetical protein